MSALERIRSMENGGFRHQDERVDFLLKAFGVMREVAIQNQRKTLESLPDTAPTLVDGAFETGMKEKRVTKKSKEKPKHQCVYSSVALWIWNPKCQICDEPMYKDRGFASGTFK